MCAKKKMTTYLFHRQARQIHHHSERCRHRPSVREYIDDSRDTETAVADT